MTWSQKKLCPLQKRGGFPRWESGREGLLEKERCPGISPEMGAGHFPSLLPSHLCFGRTCPLTCISLSLVSPNLPVSLEPSPDQPWPSFQTVSDLSLTSEPKRDQWSLLLAAMHSGKLNLACPVNFCVRIDQVSVISRNCQVIGSGKEKNCSLTGQVGKCDFVKMSI